MINIILGVNIALTMIGVIANIAMIGKKREPITAGTAIANLIINTIVIVALILKLIGVG